MGWGVHDYPSPPEPDEAYCPVCGSACEKFYRSLNGEILGCDECIDEVDAFEYNEEQRVLHAEELREWYRDV